MLNIPFGIVDLSLAPTPAIGDSVADILCECGLEYAGAPGTLQHLPCSMISKEGRRDGFFLCGWFKWCFYSGQRGSGDDQRGRGRRNFLLKN